MMGNLCSDPVILYFLLGYKSMDTSYIRSLETWRRISIFPVPKGWRTLDKKDRQNIPLYPTAGRAKLLEDRI